MFESFCGDAKITGDVNEDFQIKNTNRMHLAVAGGKRAVKRGAYYFETRCVNGCAIVGWCVSGFRKSCSSGGSNDCFYADFNKNQVIGGRNRLRISRISLNTGDIIGSLIDFDKRSVAFSYNGEFLSEMRLANLDLVCPDGYVPFVELRSGCSASVSVVSSSFIAGLPKGAQAYGAADDAGAAGPTDKELNAIFDTFASEHDKNKCSEDELPELFKAVGEESESDPIVFVFLWFVNKSTHDWVVSRDNFVRAFSEARCKTLDDIKKCLRKELNGMMSHKGTSWNSFYKFVFYLLTESGSHMVAADKAAGVWEVLGFKNWKFFNQWIDFITEKQQEKEKQAASRPAGSKPLDPALIGLDAWQSFPQFVNEYPKSFDSYDMDDLCYNTLFGDFVQKVRG